MQELSELERQRRDCVVVVNCCSVPTTAAEGRRLSWSVQELGELERRLSDQAVMCREAERRAERAELSLVDAEEQLDSLDQSLNQRHEEAQHQLVTRQKQVQCTLIYVLLVVRGRLFHVCNTDLCERVEMRFEIAQRQSWFTSADEERGN